MAQKDGTVPQRRATCFPRTAASAISSCPFKGPDIAIVPVRYALDRSRFDVDGEALKPLPRDGVWAQLPALHTRGYTLRQLYDGFVYVFDETADTFHEYAVSGADATLTLISRADVSPAADMPPPRSYLSYPRTHQLRLAFSSRPWSPRLCEQMRASPEHRARWMTALDLSRYS
ncbi:toxin VasX, partial [Pseudomonas sp. JDS28PS106]|uniref:toxin VasX n=1 Tax=Pseudomonas sp. JDS28PS106 TaxID=2497235 RepID=UPI002FD02113